jgi:hypothetical protein
VEARIQMADGLLILSRGEHADRIDHYRQLAFKHRRKLLHIDLSQRSMTEGAGLISSWIAIQHINALQVTGPNETIAPGIYKQTKRVLTLALIESIVGLGLSDSLEVIETFSKARKIQKVPTSVDAAVDELIGELSLRECVIIVRNAEDETAQLQLTLEILIRDKLRSWMGSEKFRRACLSELKIKKWDDYAIAYLLLEVIRKKLNKTHRLRVIK